MAQNAHFVRSREELKKFIDELVTLSRSQVTPEEFLRRFLEITLRAIDGRGGAVWTLQGANFQRVCGTEFVETEYDADERQRTSIHNALRDAMQHRRPVVVVPSETEAEPREGEIVNHTPFPFFYIPVMAAETAGGQPVVSAVLQAWLPPHLDPGNFKEIVTFLQAASAQTAIFLRTRRLESMAANTEKMQQVVRYVAELNGQLDKAILAVTVVNWAREILGCDRCVLFALDRKGKLRALAASNVEAVDRKSALVQAQVQLAQDSINVGQATLYRKSAPKSEALGDITDYFFHSHANEAMAVPLLNRAGEKIGALLIESHKDNRIDEPMRRLTGSVTPHAGRALGAVLEIEAVPLIKPLRRLAKSNATSPKNRRQRLLLRVGLPVALCVLIAASPWRFAVSGDCTVEPVVRARTVTETSGRLMKVFVDEGEHVTAGQAVAQLDDSDLQQELTVLQQEKLKYQAEADRSEVLGDDGGRRVAEINATRTTRQIEQIKRRVDLTYLRSPIAGVVLTKDLPTKVGELLPIGTSFCDVADLSRWEVTVQLPESEVALVDAQLREGKPVPVSFLLHAMPSQPFAATVKNLTAISQMSYQVPRANVFLLRADVNASPQTRDTLKAGYSGSGKVSLGWRPVIYVATRKFFAYVKTSWLF